MSDEVSVQELAERVLEVVKRLDAGNGVDLTHWAFDRVPGTRRRIYAIAKNRAGSWGYVYEPGYYAASGNRPFARVTAGKQGKYHGPRLRPSTGYFV